MPSYLFICGSLNQTTMMHQIARQMGDADCWFAPFYADGFIDWASRQRLLDFSILGGRHHAATVQYLEQHHLKIDPYGARAAYDVIFTCTDLIVPKNLFGQKFILVQEGMTEAEGLGYFLARYLGFPRFVANTAATGLSNAYDVFCVASWGYRDLFIRKGVRPEKIVVTGIPNYDNLLIHRKNSFPHAGYVLAATSSIRETGKPDDRMAYLRKVERIAAGREVIFKLHPNENHARAIQEIRQVFPVAEIHVDGDTNAMIANCAVLVAQTSTVIFTAMALGKEVYSDLDESQLQPLLPVQNGGRSAGRIAEIGRWMAQTPFEELRNPQRRKFHNRRWRYADTRPA